MFSTPNARRRVKMYFLTIQEFSAGSLHRLDRTWERRTSSININNSNQTSCTLYRESNSMTNLLSSHELIAMIEHVVTKQTQQQEQEPLFKDISIVLSPTYGRHKTPTSTIYTWHTTPYIPRTGIVFLPKALPGTLLYYEPAVVLQPIQKPLPCTAYHSVLSGVSPVPNTTIGANG